jgi:hypothetical protein
MKTVILVATTNRFARQLNLLTRCFLLSSRRTLLRGWLTELIDRCRCIDSKKEVRGPEQYKSEICNLCSVVTETFGVLSLFRDTQCCSYSKIKSVIINCNASRQISNKSSVKSRTHKLFVVLPGKRDSITDAKSLIVVNRGLTRTCIFSVIQWSTLTKPLGQFLLCSLSFIIESSLEYPITHKIKRSGK